ncbi:MAG TPA: Hsp70 family protein [Bryobacteraceae bacterium]|jgi:hypothetical chaperone protein|nr:Hsp70 family protein [Bryobacteraceae bacterium]
MQIGFDFGTTNSSIACLTNEGDVKLAKFAHSGGSTSSYRSLLYLELLAHASRKTIKSWSGPAAIDRYLNADERGRLIQSLKSFLSNRGLQSTEVFGRRITLEDLVANILRDIRTEASAYFGFPIKEAVVGRPIRFVGAESEAEDTYAVSRLETAMYRAGFERITFEYEPVAAAYHYESTLDRNELILIGDFGGGTSDFSLLRVGPEIRKRGREPRDLLGNEGLGLAGDAFDAKIVRHLVSPALGAGSLLHSFGKKLPVPNWVYFKLERWHHLSFLRSSETLNMLRTVRAQAEERAKLNALLYLVENDLGYQLHRSVQRAKVTLSHADRTVFRFTDGDLELEEEVRRDQFEEWIGEELALIERSVDNLLAKTGAAAHDVDMVFLTGGSSLVPAVRRIFERRFGTAKIRTGDEFTSVARGLALK